MKKNVLLLSTIIIVVLFIFAFNQNANSCSRIMYTGPDNIVITARSMDWKTETFTDIWIMPAGVEREGLVGKNSIKWTSKYGSVIASAFQVASSDGMNEKGLVCNALWLSESVYPAKDGRPCLSISEWLQYVLDNYATVDEAVTDLQKESFIVVTSQIPNTDITAVIHLSISDATGDNAVLEYIDGKLVIHHSRDYKVMTNSPVYEKQLALAEYWNEIGGLVMLPGTNRAADRFVRGSFYIGAAPQSNDINFCVASVFSIIRNMSVPIGLSTPNEPNISATRWRTVYDQKNKVMYFESPLSPNVIWIDYKDIDFSKNAKVKKLNLAKHEIYTGNATSNFKDSEPIKFLGIPD